MNFDLIIFLKTAGTLGILAMVFAESGLFFGFFLPGDSLLFTAGLLASSGYLNFWVLLIGAPICAILGDNVGYWFGKRFGRLVFTKDDSFFFNKKYLDQTKVFYDKHGKKTIFLARFVPVVRTFAPILAGMGVMDYKIFSFYNIIGGLAWSESMLLSGYFLGNLIPNIDHYILPIVGLIILVSILPILFQIFKNDKVK